MSIRAAFFIDGFNVYHALDDLGANHLKWLNWWALAERIIPKHSEILTSVKLCTALKTTDPAKLIRQRKYLQALRSVGVDCLMGHFAEENRDCYRCGAQWIRTVEKQGDVNLAIAIIDDAHRNKFDHCYLVTADGDQAATAKLMKHGFPDKLLTTVVITGRSHNKMILNHADAKITISRDNLERSLFPKVIPGANAILRPAEYDPPGG